jgi:hypothetical protein
MAELIAMPIPGFNISVTPHSVPSPVIPADTTGIVTPDDEQQFDDSVVELAASTQEQEMAEKTPAAQTYRTFTDQPVAFIGEPTSDRRILTNGIELGFRDTPLPMQWCKQNSGGHSDSYTVGVIEGLHRQDNQVLASGYLLNTPEADEAADMAHHGVTRPSIDLVGAEWHHADDDGNKLASADELFDYMDRTGKMPMTAITKGEIAGTTLVALPAFGATKMALNEEREPRDFALVASAADDFRPRLYDPALFDNPRLSGPTLPTMNEQGRIYGHLAVFGRCHRSVQSECVMVPRSPSGYAHFHTSPPVRLNNGELRPVGRLTVGTGHADPRLRPAPATAHYDNTGACFALVRVGEDHHGVWFSGVAAPGATAETIEQGLSAPLSGDWRNFGSGLDLIAVLAVNTPGFAVQGVDDSEGRPAALVASVGPSPYDSRGGMEGITLSDIKSAIVEAFTELSDKIVIAAPPAEPPAPVVEETPPPPDDKSPNQLVEEMLSQAGI